MEIVPFRQEHVAEAAAFFCRNFKALRDRLPVLPDLLEQPDHVGEKLDYLVETDAAVAAVEGGKLVGYLGAFLVDHFRETERKGAFCPEWGHAAADGAKFPIYRALYRAASAQWAAEGCGVHAITMLANDHEAEKVWFWNGFGLLVVDAIRPMTPLLDAAPVDYTVRRATLDDVETLVMLDAEHWQHYCRPPVFMAHQNPRDAGDYTEFLSQPKNSVWLAEQDGEPMAIMHFEGRSFGAADAVNAESTVAISGAYTRPAYRGRRAAVALIDAAIRDYAGPCFERCAVDFESFNPEAAAFWVKYFEPVCYSVMRVPESLGPSA